MPHGVLIAILALFAGVSITVVVDEWALRSGARISRRAAWGRGVWWTLLAGALVAMGYRLPH